MSNDRDRDDAVLVLSELGLPAELRTGAASAIRAGHNHQAVVYSALITRQRPRADVVAYFLGVLHRQERRVAQPDFVSVEVAAAEHAVSTSTIRRRIREGTLKATRVGFRTYAVERTWQTS